MFLFIFASVLLHTRSVLENCPWTRGQVELAHGLVLLTSATHWNYLEKLRKYHFWVPNTKYGDLTDAEAEIPMLWPPDAKSQLTGKDPVVSVFFFFNMPSSGFQPMLKFNNH